MYRLIAADTIEEKVLALHKTKRDLADELLANSAAPRKLDLAMLTELMA